MADTTTIAYIRKHAISVAFRQCKFCLGSAVGKWRVMQTLIKDAKLSGLRWLTFRGERRAVFNDLGRLFAVEIRSVQDAMPERLGLLKWRESRNGIRRYKHLLSVAEQTYPDVLAELESMAQGAGLDPDYLFLANIRGDIGSYDGTGCTDLVWSRERSFVAHNEDAAPAVGADLMFLSLHIEGEQPVAVQWYPGFIPSNAFAATAGNLVWGINHLPISAPGPGAGRHFAARQLQQAQSLEEAIDLLRTHPIAGGFSFNIGELKTGNVAVIESAAGQIAVHRLDAEQPFAWHTNHLRSLPQRLSAGTKNEEPHGATAQLGHISESLARGDFLASVRLPVDEPGTDWFLKLLTGKELPEGVLRTARNEDPLATLCTTITDLDAGTILVKGVGAEPETIAVEDLIAGVG